jgi:hypothetical protein
MKIHIVGGVDIEWAKVSISENIREALSENPSVASQACRVLGFLAAHGRTDAMVFLPGLLSYHRNGLKRLEPVAESLGSCISPIVATALFEEIRRLESSNTTRTYLNLVIKILARFPQEFVEDQFVSLADDSSFSPKMRAKFRGIVESFRPALRADWSS